MDDVSAMQKLKKKFLKKFHNIYLLENKFVIDDWRATWNF